MASESRINEKIENIFDGSCWESARSSWIYMEMEPRHRECWLDNSFSRSPESEASSVNCSANSGCSAVMASNKSPGTKENVGAGREFIEDLSFGYMDKHMGCSIIYEDNVSENHHCVSSAEILNNSKYVFREESTLASPCGEANAPNQYSSKPSGCKSFPARRSVSLDSYPLEKDLNILMKQSETVHFPHVMTRFKSRPPLPQCPERLIKYSVTPSPHLQVAHHFLSPTLRGSFITRTDLETDRESVTSVCTMATASTSGSCNSLYRIPAKLRKLSASSSGNSSFNASRSKTTGSSSDHAHCHCPASLHPKILQDTFSCLWCENPDRDPFNTFSVSETDLTSAIAHLEQQLSQSSDNREERISANVFSDLVQTDSSHVPSTSVEILAPTTNAMESEGGNVGLSKDLPFRVQFIMESYCNIYMTRKQDLRELKMLQKQENKQITDLQYKNQIAMEAKERKFEADNAAQRKTFDQDLDVLNKQQKQLIEKAEQAQQTDMKNAARKLKAEQDKELKLFRDKQKQELKLLKQELDLLPRDNKKETAQKIREARQIEMEEKDRLFLESQADRMEKHLKQLADQHRQKIALLENQCLQQKQQLFRAREASMWELEKNQLHERHQLLKTHLKDMFFVKRHQMLTRHQKEMDNLKRYNQTKEDEMLTRHTMEKRRLPKILKSEGKTRALMFKQSLRLSHFGSPEDDKTKIKQFEESEKKRMKAEQQRQEEKHKRQLKALTDKNEATVKELEQLQAEKRKMLMEQETLKIKELDDQFADDMNKWKAMLIPRKQALEDQFQREMEEQLTFYADVTSEDGGIPPLHSLLSGTVRSKGKDGTMNSRRSTVL